MSRGGRPIPRVCSKTILHKNGFSELFQAVGELVPRSPFERFRWCLRRLPVLDSPSHLPSRGGISLWRHQFGSTATALHFRTKPVKGTGTATARRHEAANEPRPALPPPLLLRCTSGLSRPRR